MNFLLGAGLFAVGLEGALRLAGVYAALPGVDAALVSREGENFSLGFS